MVYRPGLIKRGFTVQKHIKVIPHTASEQLGSLGDTSEPMEGKKKVKASQVFLIGPAASTAKIPHTVRVEFPPFLRGNAEERVAAGILSC